MGVDVGKDFFDIYIWFLGEYFKVSNDKKGIGEVIKRLRKLIVECIVIEVIGCYEIVFVSVCVKVVLFFSVVNFIYVKCFVGVIGCKVKMDKFDVVLIVYFSEVI